MIKDAALKRCLTDLAAAGPAAADGAGPSTSSAAAPPAAAAAPGVEPGLFADYASGIVNTVMHYFKAGGAAWNRVKALPHLCPAHFHLNLTHT